MSIWVIDYVFCKLVIESVFALNSVIHIQTSDRWETQYQRDYVMKFTKIALNCVKILAVYLYGMFQ